MNSRLLLLALFTLAGCTSGPNKPPGTVFVYGDDREEIVAILQTNGIKAIASAVGSTSTKSPVFVAGVSFRNEKLVDELRYLLGDDLEVRESTYKNYFYLRNAGLFLHSEEQISSGFAGSCTGDYVDITIDGRSITMTLSDWNGTKYGADRVEFGDLEWDGDVAKAKFPGDSTLEFKVGWNSDRMATTLKIQRSSKPKLSGCIMVEKRVYS